MANIAIAALALPKIVWQEREANKNHDVLAFSADLAGFPRGAVSEILGPASSGRTAILHAVLAAASSRGEACAIVDWRGAFDPTSAAANGVRLEQLLWVRTARRLDRSLTATDWILHAGGFGVVALDLCGAAPNELRRVPLTWWHRFRHAVQDTPAIFLLLAEQPLAGSCAASSASLERSRTVWSGSRHMPLLDGIEMRVTPRRPVERAGKIVGAHWGGSE